MSIYARRRVYLSHMESESYEEVVIIKSFQDAGEWFYRVKHTDGGSIVDIPSKCVTSIVHCESSVKPINKSLRVVKKPALTS